MEASEIKDIAKKCELFKTLEDEEFDLLLFYGEMKDFSSGATIYKTGDTAEGTFCLILSGSVEALTQTGRNIRKMGPGEIIGEIGATSPQNKRTVTIRTLEPTAMLEWEIKHIGTRWPALLKKLKDQAWKHLAQYYESAKK
ncbi:MAG: cyclic nucleotide-binding domain-containing protein [Desulfobacterota bacterium]|jgi:CRP-like cAMP-binding protein|nr:cyclic nucleotide-binding domain-containing protein [Thermodesulfobacteriota bacterium]